MIDIETENLLPLAKAAGMLPGRQGKRCHESTVLRWVLKGCNGVKLEAIRMGGRWLTSLQALQRFAQALTPNQEEPPAKPPRSPASRQRASKRAAEQLEKVGI